jgi:dihydroorotase-like cyclic amidohydrolase
MKLTGWPVKTILRGRVVFEDGGPVGGPSGEFQRRT